MSKPVLFLVDDDPRVAQALEDDLSRRFGQDFFVVGTSRASDGLATLHGLAGQEQPVALLIASHAMHEMPGVDFLGQAHEMHPLAKRVLLSSWPNGPRTRRPVSSCSTWSGGSRIAARTRCVSY
jgi:thioredoxin reductase (NADPH)